MHARLASSTVSDESGLATQSSGRSASLREARVVDDWLPASLALSARPAACGDFKKGQQ